MTDINAVFDYMPYHNPSQSDMIRLANSTVTTYHMTVAIIVGFWMTAFLCLIGLLGNILSLIILNKREDCAMFILLRGLLVSDVLFLLATLLLQVRMQYFLTRHFMFNIAVRTFHGLRYILQSIP